MPPNDHDVHCPASRVVLGPGDECVLCEVFRCAHCLRVVGWDQGCSVGPDDVITDSESEFLDDCCDDCWVSIATPLYRAHERMEGGATC